MSIQVGQVLDKYELLERVGQGGMAVVYRGIDRQLKRTVAVKILHRHLSDYQEARDRFEREAQAVAKLRHENILEIFDYSAKDESYIVTEFIDGQTLKQFITERPIAFPEVGAMVVLQVCRALAHAHAAGILHRDVKPENIMIRSDGVVKLMDFGISHMVDLERLTVTGQLLGSPAYMAPEHVEGRPLDYRTDVFAAGIVLYQLTVGKLPFEGKNPHEVLKRIAECKFVDPRQANPRIGNRLGKIILRAMAAMPVDRYPSVGEMVVALETYLVESGLPTDKLAGELARYFQAPTSYEQALRTRLVDQLARRGQELLASDDRAGALDVFDRVLTIDKDNARVLAILDGINRRTRVKQGVVFALCAVGLGTGVWFLTRPPDAEQPPELDVDPLARVGGDHSVTHEPATPIATRELDAGAVAVAPSDGGRVVVVTPPPHPVDAALAPRPIATRLKISPIVDSEYRVGVDGPWLPVPASGEIELGLVADVEIHARNQSGCCQEGDLVVRPGSAAMLTMGYLPGSIVATCKGEGGKDLDVSVNVDGKAHLLNRPFPIAFGDDTTMPSKQIFVEFHGDERVDTKPIAVTVEAHKNVTVKCVQR